MIIRILTGIIAAAFFASIPFAASAAAQFAGPEPVTLDPPEIPDIPEPAENESLESDSEHSYSLIMSDTDEDGEYDTIIIRGDEKTSNYSRGGVETREQPSGNSSKVYTISKHKKHKIQCITFSSKLDFRGKQCRLSPRYEFVKTIIKKWAKFSVKSWNRIQKTAEVIMSF